MKIKSDQRGAHRAALKIENREKILSFFAENPDATYAVAAASLGLSLHTVFRHVKDAEAGR